MELVAVFRETAVYWVAVHKVDATRLGMLQSVQAGASLHDDSAPP